VNPESYLAVIALSSALVLPAGELFQQPIRRSYLQPLSCMAFPFHQPFTDTHTHTHTSRVQLYCGEIFAPRENW